MNLFVELFDEWRHLIEPFLNTGPYSFYFSNKTIWRIAARFSICDLHPSTSWHFSESTEVTGIKSPNIYDANTNIRTEIYQNVIQIKKKLSHIHWRALYQHMILDFASSQFDFVAQNTSIPKALTTNQLQISAGKFITQNLSGASTSERTTLSDIWKYRSRCRD